MPITSGVPIVGFISPTEDSDTYPVTNPKYGLGGLRTIGASAGLTSIPNRRREEGMIVYAIDAQKYYHLSGGTSDENWEELTFGGVGSQGFQGVQGFQGFQGLRGSGSYFYGATAPSADTEGLTLGSKWFNTEVGGEFTYLSDPNDGFYWVMTNVFSATGPQGPVGQGTEGNQGNQGFQGFQGNTGSEGNQGFQGFQGKDGGGFTFPNDFPVNIAIGKTFGKYERGDIIPATGKTVTEVLNLALNENLPPTSTVSTNPTSIDFNETNPSITINFGYEINSPGATGLSASLEYRIGSIDSWSSLTSGTLGLTSFSGVFNHSPIIPSFNTENLNYRYVVEDSVGETNSSTDTITQTQHQNPSVSISIQGTNISSPETHYLRERGNSQSEIQATITRNSVNVDLVDWGYQYRTSANSSYTNILTNQTISNPASFTTPNQSHTGPTSGISWIQYRFIIEDEYETNYYTSNQIQLDYFIFYGPTSNSSQNSSDVRSSPNREFTTTINNPFSFSTGITSTNFMVALPENIEISGVVDNQDVDLTTNFTDSLTSFSVNDYANNTKTYNVYNYTTSIPYDPEATFFVTTTGSLS